MSLSSIIETEIDELWVEHHADACRVAEPRSEFRELRSNLWEKNQTLGQEHLQPWVSIFELGLEWLAYVHLALNNDDDIGPRKPEYRVPWALVGAASSFGWSLRHACLLGFDTPARALLRTYVESLFLCLAVLNDKKLGEMYSQADTDSKVVSFWHTVASPKKLHHRIIEIEKSAGLDPGMISDLTEWRRGEYEVMSQSSHLSYLASAMTCLPISAENKEEHRIGIFGRASANSSRTLSYAALTTWYFSRLSFGKLLGHSDSDDSLLILNKEDENHRSIVIGREVLSEITTKYWS